MTIQTTRLTTVVSTSNLDASAGSSTSPQATRESTSMVPAPAGSQTTAAASEDSTPILGTPLPYDPGQRASKGSAISTLGTPLADPFLALAADVLDDLEKVRIANENRLRQLTRDQKDADGEERGFGLDESHPDVARLAALVDMLGRAEHQSALNLQRLMRRHPLGPWVKAQRGVGEKQAARLLAAIGDPYWNTLHDRPRTVSELWAYAGYHVIFPADHPINGAHGAFVGGEQTGGDANQGASEAQTCNDGIAPKRARGQRANWSSAAKTRAFLVAESTLKQLDRTCPVDPEVKAAVHTDGCGCSPFRRIYDDTRRKYADAVHGRPCVRCGPAGKPALAGTDLSDGHKHARAMRAVAKELLKELWREARRIHEAGPDGQKPPTPHAEDSCPPARTTPEEE